MTQAQTEHDNIVFMRKWLDLGNRYGNIEEVMDGVLEEVLVTYPESQLPVLVKHALEENHATNNYHSIDMSLWMNIMRLIIGRLDYEC